MTRVILSGGLAVCVVALAGCEQIKSSSPLSPVIAGPMAGVEISTPKPLEPEPGRQIKPDQQPVKFVIENPSSNSPRPFTLLVEISGTTDFASPLFRQEKISPGDNGRTSFVLPASLQVGRKYSWRVRADDGANSSPYSPAVQFELLEPVIIQAPTPTSPTGNEQTANRRPVLTVLNAAKSGPFKSPVIYLFEVALDQAFGQRVVLEEGLEGTFQTTLTSPHDLAASATHYWRARATDGEVTGPWSATSTFRTPAAPAPPPGGGGGGGGGGGAPCVGPLSPLGILECHRSKYGAHMSKDELLQLLKGSARDFNSTGVPDGPFGILRKESGNNCFGYSCDILCTGQGGSQKQYDVLIDENIPTWGGPLEGPIRVDVCEIQ